MNTYEVPVKFSVDAIITIKAKTEVEALSNIREKLFLAGNIKLATSMNEDLIDWKVDYVVSKEIKSITIKKI